MQMNIHITPMTVFKSLSMSCMFVCHSASIYSNTYIDICICACAYTYAYTCTLICTCTYTCTYSCTYTYTFVDLHVRAYLWKHLHLWMPLIAQNPETRTRVRATGTPQKIDVCSVEAASGFQDLPDLYKTDIIFLTWT